MNRNLSIEALDRVKTVVDGAIDAFEELRRQQHRRRGAPTRESLMQQRDAISRTIIRMQELANAIGLHAAASPVRLSRTRLSPAKRAAARI
jgi:hypothetical protein